MLETLGNLGDFIGGIAVVVTLIYLASQIRQNTRALQAASRQAVAAVSRENIEILTRDDVNGAYSLGLRFYPKISAEQKRRFGFALDHYLNYMQEVLALYEGGSLDREIYGAHFAGLAGHLATPGGAAYWRESRQLYPPHFAEQVDHKVAVGGYPDMLEHAYFQLDDVADLAAKEDGAGSVRRPT
jgi:hypothetical protein